MASEVSSSGKEDESKRKINEVLDIEVSRYEEYPRINPIGTCVGLTIKNRETGSSIYRDTLVKYTASQGKSNEEIVKLGLEELRPLIETWYESSKIMREGVIGLKLQL